MVFYKIVGILKDSGEGRCFLQPAGAKESCKKCCPGATGKSVGRAAFLHNVIIAAQHYNATLCKEAWEEKLPAQVTKCTCYCTNNCDGNFLGALAKRWICSLSSYTKLLNF